MLVSAKFVKDLMTGATDRLIEAIDDHDPPRVWSVPGMDCDVGDWQAYLAGGGTVAPYEPTIDESVISAPPGLFGGPTIEEVLRGNG